MTSVRSYKDFADFRQSIRNLVNKPMSISHALAGFREISIFKSIFNQFFKIC